MAKFNYSDYESTQVKSAQTKERSNVGYFKSLKDNGDTAIVRFAYHSPSEFDIVTIHKAQINGNWRSISCLKGPYDSVDNCPLCKAGVKLNRKIYVKMLEYVRDENGNIVPKAVIWERPAEGKNDFVKKLMSIIGAGYSDLSKYVFTIKRNGFKGSLDTTYDVNPANPDIYPANVYVPDFKDFEGFTLTPHSYIERSFEDLDEFVRTGTMPQFKSSKTVQVQTTTGTQYQSEQFVQPTQQVSTPVVQQVQQVGVPTSSGEYTPVGQQTVSPSTATSPVDGVRPRRTTYTF